MLAWISKAYADRRNLLNPEGLVYARLKKNERPPAWMLKNPVQGLPEDYLIAIGLREPAEEHASTPAVDCSADEEVDPIPDESRQAWRSLFDGVEKGPFKALSQSAKLVSCGDGVLTIGIMKVFSKIWQYVETSDEAATRLQEMLAQEGYQVKVPFQVI